MGTSVPRRRGVALLLVGLFLAAVSTRPQLVGIGPLLGRIQDDLGVSHAAAGLLSTIPVLCMGLFAPAGPRVVARLGAAWGVGLCIGLIAFGGLLRTAGGGLALIVACTFILGVGMGFTGSAMPVVVAQLMRDGRAMATGLYVAGINVGSTLSSAAAVPLSDAAGGWRPAMAIVSVATIALLVAWLAIARASGATARRSPAPPPWRGRFQDRRVWLLVAMFVVLTICFYGLISWLADAFQERGWSAAAAGALVATFNLASLPGALLVPWVAQRRGGARRDQILAVATMYAVALILFAGVPWLAWPAAVLGGFANGGLLALVMVLPIDMAENPAEVGVLAGSMLGAGYTLAAAAPVLLGAVRDLTGSYTAVLWTVAASAVALVLLTRRLERPEPPPGSPPMPGVEVPTSV